MSCKPTFVAGSALAALLIVAASPVVDAQPPPVAPKKHALLIGVNEYLARLDVPELRYAENDVAGLKAALTARGYSVLDLVGHDAKRETVISYLEQEARVLGPQDSFVLYLAGHGAKANDHVYWLAHDTNLSFLAATGLRLNHLMDYVKDIKAERKIVLLDHCYSGELLDDLNPATSGPTTGPPPAPTTGPTPTTTISAVAVPAAGVPRAGTSGARLSGARNVDPTEALGEIMGSLPGSLVLAASRGSAYEMQQFQHGVFTKVLLDALTTRKADITPADGNLSADELRSFVDSEVKKISKELNLPQTPLEDVRGSLQGWLVATGLPATQAQDVAREIQNIQNVLRTWQQQGRLTTLQRLKCYEVLDRWKDAIDHDVDERTLSDYALLQTIRDVVSNEGGDVARRVRILVDDLANRSGGGQ